MDGKAPAIAREFLFPPNVDSSQYTAFGSAVDANDRYRVVAADRDRGSGSVHVFDATTDELFVTLRNPDDPYVPNGSFSFGSTIGLSGSRIAVYGTEGDSGINREGVVYVFDMESSTPENPVVVLRHPAPTGETHFGEVFSMDGNTIVVQGWTFDEVVLDQEFFVFDLSALDPQTPIATFDLITSPLDLATSLAIDDETIAIGSAFQDSGATGSGSVHLFQFDGLTATFVDTIDNPDPDVGDNFGYSLGISNEKLVVGANEINTGSPRTEQAFVFDLSTLTPTLLATLDSPTPDSNDAFGTAVAIDGDTVVIGAFAEDVRGVISGGAVYVYQLSDSGASLPRTIENPDPNAARRFGRSVSIFGSQVVVGRDGDANWQDAEAFVFDLDSLTPEIPTGSLIDPAPSENRFGVAVAVSENYAVVAEPGPAKSFFDSGRVLVYDVSSGDAGEPLILENPNFDSTQEGSDGFSRSVVADGEMVVVGASADETFGFETGAVHIYDMSSATPESPVLTLADSTPASGDLFGDALATSGTFVAVAIPGDDTVGEDAGRVELFDRSSPTPSVPILTFNNPGPTEFTRFGTSVALAGDRLAVGALGNAGASDGVFVFDLSAPAPTVHEHQFGSAEFFYEFATASPDTSETPIQINGDRLVVGARVGSEGRDQVDVYDLASPDPANPTMTIEDPTHSRPFRRFGATIALEENILAVEDRDDDPWVENTGRVLLYDLDGPNPSEPFEAILNPTPKIENVYDFDRSVTDFFGSAIAINGDKLLVGSPFDARDDYRTGASILYQIDIPRPEVESIVINDVSDSRSQITSLTVTFDTLVDHAMLDEAFRIENLDTETVVDSLVVSPQDSAGQTVVTLSFASGASVDDRMGVGSLGHSLADGNYRLDVFASKITGVAGGFSMQNDYRFGGQLSNQMNNDDFFRLYGDANGDGNVNFDDFASHFLPAFGSSGVDDPMDFNGDGAVNFADFAGGFLSNFGTSRL